MHYTGHRILYILHIYKVVYMCNENNNILYTRKPQIDIVYYMYY